MPRSRCIRPPASLAPCSSATPASPGACERERRCALESLRPLFAVAPLALMSAATSSDAATIFVAAGGDLQKALNTAQPGDTMLLQEGLELVANFILPV